MGRSRIYAIIIARDGIVSVKNTTNMKRYAVAWNSFISQIEKALNANVVPARIPNSTMAPHTCLVVWIVTLKSGSFSTSSRDYSRSFF